MTTLVFDSLFSIDVETNADQQNKYIEYESCLISFLEYIIRNNLLCGKSTIISVSDVSSIPHLAQQLHSFKHYILDLSRTSQIGELEISKLRIRMNHNYSPLDSIAYQQDQLEQEQILNETKQHFRSLYNSDFGTDRLIHLIQKQHYANRSLAINELEFTLQNLNLNFDVDELDRYLKMIKRATELYHPIYNLIGHQDLITVESELNQNALRENLTAVQLKGKALLYQLNDQLFKYQKKQINSLNESLRHHQELKKSLDNITEKFALLQAGVAESDSYSLLGISTSFKKKNTLSKANQIIGVEFEAWRDRFASLLPDLFAIFVQAEDSTLTANLKIASKFITSELSKLHDHRNSASHLSVEQLNIHNCGDAIRDTCSDIANYVSELNHSHLISKPLCDNSFNILNKKEYLSALLQSISYCIQLCNEHPDVFSWENYMSKLSATESRMIRALISEIDDSQLWQATFKKYYIKRFLESQLISSSHKSERYATLFNNRMSTQGENCSATIDSIQRQSFDSVMEKVKSIDQNLYKALFKKKYDDSEIGIHNLSSVIHLYELFPVIFVNKNQLQDQVFSGVSWDSFIHIDTDKFQRENDATAIDAREYIRIKHPIDHYALSQNNDINAKDILSIDTKEYITHPAIRTDDDLLKFARSLSSKLELFKDRIKILQVHDRFYISFLDMEHAARMKSIYVDYNVKEFLIDFDLNYSLSDIFLNDPSQISFITQDHLIDPYDCAHVEYQYYLITLMQRAGYQHENISLEEIFVKGDLAYHVMTIAAQHDTRHLPEAQHAEVT